jgi:hypothetical protein
VIDFATKNEKGLAFLPGQKEAVILLTPVKSKGSDNRTRSATNGVLC